MKKFYEKQKGHRILNKKYWPPVFADYNRKEFLFLKENIPKGSTVLDVGCGEGRHLKILPKRIKFGVGIDNSKTMIKKSRKNLAGCKNIQILYQDAEKLSFDNNHFDYVICMNNTFGNLYEKQEKALKEMKRVTKKGGSIILSINSSKSVPVKFQLYRNIGLTGIKKIDDYMYTNEGFKSQHFTKKSIRNYFDKINLKARIITLSPMSYVAIAKKA